VAGDGDGDVLTSTDPSSPTATWSAERIDPAPRSPRSPAGCPELGLHAISCPSAGLCVAVAGGINFNSPSGGPGGGIWSITDPATARPRWRKVLGDTDDELAVSCHAAAVCLAIDVDGRAAASLDPAAADPRWSIATIDPEAVFTGVSCPTSRVCLAVDDDGYLRIAHRG
jgi:hypothetical protein